VNPVFCLAFLRRENILRGLIEKIDIRDVLIFGGLLSLSYGSYELRSWLGFVVLGAVSMLLGLGWILRRPGK
jgi:hypothetical protein